MKKILLFICLGAVISALATSTDSDKEKKIRELLQEKKRIMYQMHQLRVELIKRDPELQKLHSKIMAMYRELGIKIDSKTEMKELITRTREIERSIIKITKKSNEDI